MSSSSSSFSKKKTEDVNQSILSQTSELLKYIGVYKEDIHRMVLVMKNSVIKTSWLAELFEEGDLDIPIPINESVGANKKKTSFLSGEHKLEEENCSYWKVTQLFL